MTTAPTPDPVLGFYGPHSVMWRVNREALLLGAGPASLLLQVAHPLIAAGVAQHSDFATDPFGRLRRTLATTLDLVFGDGPTAERAVARLNRVHAGVRGPSGEEAARLTGADAYRALDPDLLLWVQATLIVTSVPAYRRWVGELSELEAGTFWQEARRVGVRMGIPLRASPATWPDLLAYWDRSLAPDGPIQVTAEARAMAPMLVRPPSPGARLGGRSARAAWPGAPAAPHPRCVRHRVGRGPRAGGRGRRVRDAAVGRHRACRRALDAPGTRSVPARRRLMGGSPGRPVQTCTDLRAGAAGGYHTR
ncbi:MAG: oxygenase MpaB family protein [Chloroflexota bacterium]